MKLFFPQLQTQMFKQILEFI